MSQTLANHRRARRRSLVVGRALVLGVLALSACGASSCKAPRGPPAPAPEGKGVVFLTFADEDTSRTLSVRYLSGAQLEDPKLVVQGPSDEDGAPLAYSTSHREVEGRHLYAFDLSGLEPATRYVFLVKDGERELREQRSFTTLPDDDRPLTVAQGGDLSLGEMPRKLLATAAKQSPDVLALGGDLAYGDGLPSSAPRWDEFLANLDELLVTPDERTIPVIFAIGNHEVRGSFLQPPAHAPFWFGYLSDVRDQDRPAETSFVRSLGENAALVVLDSAHIQSHAAQTGFLAEALARASSKPFSFAMYHVPLYPSVRDFTKPPSDEGRRSWVPLFDRHGLTVAFENHDHALKRTPPMKAGAATPGGTIYLGDGCMGASERPVLEGAPYLAKASRDSHFWLAFITKDAVRFRALDENGRVLDEVTVRADSVDVDVAAPEPPPASMAPVTPAPAAPPATAPSP